MIRPSFTSATALGAVLPILLTSAAWSAPNDDAGSAELRRAVTVPGILVHEERLQQIADRNDGTRASGTPGYDRSAAYVAAQLRDAGYRVRVQSFDFPFYREISASELEKLSPGPQVYVNGTDFATMEYSGDGEVTGTIVPIDVIVPIDPNSPASTSTSGCEASDFPPAPADAPAIALMQRGLCTFEIKATNAVAAGYDAAIIFNEGQAPLGRDVLLEGVTLGVPTAIPVVGTTYALGEALVTSARAGATVVRIETDTVSEQRQTANVIADTPRGREDRIVVVGAHLNSVPAGPGINDNGSGTSTNLEIALQMSKLKIRPANKVRFAFWGAEENGLLGSTYYVENLSRVELARLDLNLNFDMVASPNYVRFVYDGDGSDTPDAGPEGSALIERVFNEYFLRRGLATSPTAFDGRSDYGPFIDVGIPAGGLFTGAEGIKTPEEAAIYGGTAGVAYDPCYHEACDDIDNLSLRSLDQMSDAVAHAVYRFAMRQAPVGARVAAAEAKSVAVTSNQSTRLYKGDSLQR